MTKAQLRKRWTLQQLKRISNDLELGKHPRDALELDRNGAKYVDLRGIVITETIEVLKMYRWDLSYANLGIGGWTRASQQKVAHSRFIELRLRGNIGGHFSDCDFSSAQLKCDFIGLFERCLFQGTNLRHSGYRSNRRFIQCDFTNADLRDADLNDVIFDHCIWTGAKFGGGTANGTQWIGTQPNDKQLGDTYIMTPEEVERERRIAIHVEEEMKREKRGKRSER